MARRPTNPDRDVEAPVRRAPYSDNPEVGTRGHRTRQRILDAALQVFGEHGYERSTLDKISQAAGCSRVSIYQYFSGKDDVFRQLAGQVARQMRASAEALEPLTPDARGRSALRAWVARYADIHTRYEPVFRAFGAAAESDASLADDSVRTGQRTIGVFQSKLSTTTLPPRQLDPVVSLLLAGVTRSFDIASILRAAAPDTYTRARVEDAVTDVLHRALFGLLPDVNAHRPDADRPPQLRIGTALVDVFTRAEAFELDAAQPGRKALASLLDVGQDVIVRRGYQGTRVDDVVAAAGVSHGAFYRYFRSKDELAHVLAVRAIRHVSTAFNEIPDVTDDGVAGRAALRRWLRRYNATHATETAMIQVWVDAAHQDHALRQDSAAALDWGRRAIARFLAPREFGDVDIDAVVMVALLSAFGGRERPSATIDAAAHIIERGLLGR
jgi:AcrR family transcriptional regulator